MNNKSKIIGISVVVFTLSLIFSKLFIYKVITVGFTAQLTGSQAELGVQERNGAELAFENINNSGGINKRKVNLIIKDDLGKPESAIVAEKELIKEGAVAIIGHATSGQTMAGMDATKNAGIILLSPTVSTPKLSKIDDNFFRVYPSFRDSSRAFADYVYNEGKIRKIGIIYDLDNKAYAETYSETFSEEFKNEGGEISSSQSYSSRSNTDFSEIIDELSKSGAQGVLIISSDNDTALIAQKIKLRGLKIAMFTSAWAQTQTLISNGGKAVEGMILEQSYTSSSKDPEFIKFQEQYLKRFGTMPSFGAAFSYEAAMVLADAMKRSKKNFSNLKESLKNTKNFQGLMDEFSIDQFGDVERPFYLSVVENNEFKVIKKLNFAKESGN